MDLDFSTLAPLSPGASAAQPKKPNRSAIPNGSIRGAPDLDRLISEEGADGYADVIRAIYAQESGSGANTRTSVNGALGGMQVIPDTFKRVMPEGDMANPEHLLRAGVRYARQLGDRFGGDPARIAVGYFSGEGNVSKDGDTPYLRDAKDGNGKSVSGYVNDILGRTGRKPSSGTAPPQWSAVAADPDFKKLSDEDKEAVRNRYFINVVLPTLPTDQIAEVRALFDERTALPSQSFLADAAKTLGGSVVKSGGGALVRGAGELAREMGQDLADRINRVAGTELRAENPLEAPAAWLERQGQAMLDNRSSAAQQAEKDSTPQGNIFTGEGISPGDNPSAKGYALLGLSVLGSLAPVVAAAVATRGRSAGAQMAAAGAVGGAQGSGGAAQQAREQVAALTDEQLQAESQMYRDLIQAGASQTDARAQVTTAAEQWAWRLTAPVSAVGGAATGALLGKTGQAALGKLGGSAIGRTAAGAAAGAAEEAAQEVAEGVTTNAGINRGAGMDGDLGEGSFANAVLGAMGGFGMGGVRGAASGGHAAKSADEPLAANEVLSQPAAEQPPPRPALPAPAQPTDWEVVDGQPTLPGPTEAQPAVAEPPRLPPATPSAIMVDSQGNAAPQPAAARAEAVTRQAEQDIAIANEREQRARARAEREAMGLTDDVLQAQHARALSQATPDAASQPPAAARASQPNPDVASPVEARAAPSHPLTGSLVSFRTRGKTVRGRVAEVANDKATVVLGEEPLEQAGYRAALGGVPLTRLRQLMDVQGPKAPESRAPAANGAIDDADAIAVLQAFGDEFKGSRKLDINLVRSADEVPPGAVQSANTEAWYERERGRVTVVLDNLATGNKPLRLFEVLTHEIVGHHGMESLVRGKDFDALLADVNRVMHGDIRPEDRGADGHVRIGNRNYATVEAVREMYPDAAPAEVAMEVLARAAEVNAKPGFVDRLVAIVSRALRPALKALGIERPLTRGEVLGVVRRARDHLRRGENTVLSSAEARRVSEVQGGASTESRGNITETPAFKSWFGDSKVVDADGRPLVVYHGTKQSFDEFSKKGGLPPTDSDSQHGFFFDSNPDQANLFAMFTSGGLSGANVMPVYLAISNPAVADFELTGGVKNLRRFSDFLDAAKGSGRDGARIKSSFLGATGETFVAFRAEQIKSAVGNRGTFDPKKPSIVESRGAGERDEYGAFNLDRNTDDIDPTWDKPGEKVSDEDYFPSESERDLFNDELLADQHAAEQDQSQVITARELARSYRDVPAESIKTLGVFAEDAFPAIDHYRKTPGSSTLREAAVFDARGQRQEAQLRSDKGTWRAHPPELPGDGAASTFSGLSEEAAKTYNRRVLASDFLKERGFDLLDGAATKAVNSVIKAWRRIAQMPGAFEYITRIEEPEGKTSLERINSIARQMFDGTGIGVEVVPGDQGSGWLKVKLTDKKGLPSEAEIEFRGGVNGVRRRFVVHAAGLNLDSGMGKPLYQLVQAMAGYYGASVTADPMGLLGVNTYRRTEQMFSGAARFGRSGPMQPGVGQRIYGWNNQPKTKTQGEQNFARIALAQRRNVGEMVPEFRADDIHYGLADDRFTRGSEDAETLVAEILKRPDVRAAGISRSTLARAAITAQAMAGRIPDAADVKRPVLYSKGAAERENAARWRSWVERAWMRKPTEDMAVVSMQAPHDAYQLGDKNPLGARQPFIMPADVMSHIRDRHEQDGIDLQMVKRLPDLLSRPRAIVFDDGKVEVTLPARSGTGAPVLAVLKKESVGNGEQRLRFSRMATMYPNDNSVSYLVAKMKEGSRVWLPSEELSRLRTLLQERVGSLRPDDQSDLSQPVGLTPDRHPAVATSETKGSVLSDEALRKYRAGDKTWPKATEQVGIPRDTRPLKGAAFSRGAGERSAEPSSGPLDWIAKKAGGTLVRDWVTQPLWNIADKVVSKVVPERVKMGIVSDFGLSPEYTSRRTDRDIEVHKTLRGATRTLDDLAHLSRQEARIAYLWMNEKPDTELEARLMAQLPEDARERLREMKRTIDGMGKAAVEAGLLSQDSYDRNRMAYLHRSYLEHEALKKTGTSFSSKNAASVRADTYKGRGIRDDVDQDKLVQRIDDEIKQGDKLLRIERRGAAGKLAEVSYIRPDAAVPPGFEREHLWEVRWPGGPSAKTVGLWRDLTPQERQRLGEIDEVRFAFAKTILSAARDIENQKFLGWIADTYGKDSVPEDKISSGNENHLTTRAYKLDEWVKVPDTTIAGTGGLKKYGAAAGKFVPAVVWNDIRNTMAVPEGELAQWFHTLTRAWKLSKTALSVGVHTNNVMSNVILADLADLGVHHVAGALRTIIDAKRGDADAKAMMERYEDSGAEIGSMAARELNLKFIEPLLKDIEAQQAQELGLTKLSQIVNLAAHGKVADAMKALSDRREVRALGKPFELLLRAYHAEDSVFRLAKFMRETELGASDKEAGKMAREAFLDYSINAPWVQTLRRSGLPFIAFSYRAIPLIAKGLRDKPWKMGKYMASFAAMNAMVYAWLGMSGDDAERERRRNLPEELQGKIWGVFPRAMRMPWNDERDQPVFLDVRRWIPAGDVFDLNANHSALPLPNWLQAAGPLALFMELGMTMAQFTGKPIFKSTDTTGEKIAKVADHVFKWAAPNLPVPGPGYLVPGTTRGQLQTFSWQGIRDAETGRTDAFGREMSTAQAVASAVGVKLRTYPEDTARLRIIQQFGRESSEIDENMSALIRELARKGITRQEFDRGMAQEKQKLKDASSRMKEALGR